MENSLIVGLLVTNLTTNWVFLGNLDVKDDKDWTHHYRIEEGYVETNWYAKFTLKEKEHEVYIYKNRGPSVGLRKSEFYFTNYINFGSFTNFVVTTNWTNIWIR